MIQFLNKIFSLIKSLITFVIHTFESLIALFTQIPKFIGILTDIIMNLPPFIQPFILASLSIIVVQYILNRKAD